MALIKLTRGKYALIDKEDFEKVNQYTWCCLKNGYAQKNSGDKIYMHRFIMNAPKNKDVDHINGNSLDNRRSNLRLCSPSQNMFNIKKHKDNTSGYKGVSWDKRARKWVATITVNYKHLWGGQFDSKEKAAERYNILAEKYSKEFANLNKI